MVNDGWPAVPNMKIAPEAPEDSRACGWNERLARGGSSTVRAAEEDPCPTPIAQAVHLRSEPPPESTPVQVDQRIDRLLAENLALLTERKQLRLIADERATRANELLAEARKAKKLVRAVIEEKTATDYPPDVCDAWGPLVAWAAETL